MFFTANRHRGRLLLRECSLADPDAALVLPGMSLLIEDGIVTAVSSSIPATAARTVIDLRGAMVTPGLIDAHVHLTLDAGPTPDLRLEVSLEQRQAIIRDSLARSLAAGVTTVRDLGSRADMLTTLREFEAGAGAGIFPTVLASGPVLTVAGGHGAVFGEITHAGNIDKVLDRALAAGVDCVKLISSGGYASPHTDVHQPQYSDEEFASIVHAAHARGLSVACHAHATEAIDQCLRYGVDSIEHASYLTPEQVVRLGESDICWVPTLAPGPLVPDLPPAAADRVARRRVSLAQAIGAGVTVAAGTDAGITGVPHGSLPYELDEYIAAGMTTMQALRSATRSCAELLDIGDRKGHLGVGADADLVVYPRHLDDVHFSFHDPAVVLRGGVVAAAAGPFAEDFSART